MKKILMALAAAICCAMASTVAKAQTNVDEVLKQVEEAVKLADKQPADGMLQLKAGQALIWNELGDRKDYDRSLNYANRALQIAEAQAVLKDTLKARAYLLLGDIYLNKRDLNKAFDCCEKGLDALTQELGRYDPWTISMKIYVGYSIMGAMDIRRGALMIQQAFLDSELAPEDKRIQNIEDLNSLYELSLEYQMAQMAKIMKYGLPLIVFEGRRYLILEAGDWNMEMPIVGWLMPGILEKLSGENPEETEPSEVILCDFDDTRAPLRAIAADAKNRPDFKIQFMLNPSDPRHLKLPDENGRLWFFPENIFNDILKRYHDFKAH